MSKALSQEPTRALKILFKKINKKNYIKRGQLMMDFRLK